MDVTVRYSASKSKGFISSEMEIEFKGVEKNEDTSNINRILSHANTKQVELPKEDKDG